MKYNKLIQQVNYAYKTVSGDKKWVEAAAILYVFIRLKDFIYLHIHSSKLYPQMGSTGIPDITKITLLWGTQWRRDRL
jgi:hypothetical protein